MPIKDKVVSFYVKNFIIPRSQCFDKPGFIYFHMSGKTPVFSRQVIMPETFLVLLEKKLSGLQGSLGCKKLYSVGKRFGYRFALMGGFETKNKIDKSSFLNNFEAVNKFIEGTYASEITQKTDYEQDVVSYQLKNFIVCGSFGHGYFLPLGAAAGLIARMFENPHIEGIHLACQGKGAPLCKLIYGPLSFLQKNYPQVETFSEENLIGLDLEQEYMGLNKVQPTKNSNYSFKSFLDTNFFEYHEGIIMRGDQRYFILEVSAIYLLEKELEDNAITKDMLFSSAFETGQLMLKNIGLDPNVKTIIDLLTAFGWGDVFIVKKENKYVANIDFFPYSKFFKDTNFTFFSGLLSGLLSVVDKRKIEFSKVNKSILSGSLSISFFQS